VEQKTRYFKEYWNIATTFYEQKEHFSKHLLYVSHIRFGITQG